MSSHVITWPAPAGEAPSPDFTVEVDGCPVFVYQARVRAEILQHPGLWTHQPDARGERASFAIFDISVPVTVTVRVARPFTRAAVLPARAEITPEPIDGGIRFTLDRPRHLTVLLDGSDRLPLHLFVSEPEVDAPRPDDPDVVYFGPGVHELESLALRDGQTAYLAGGAVVKAVLRPGEEGRFSDKWNVTFYSGVVLDVHQATGVRICGRGILDGSLVPHPGRSMIRIDGARDVQVSGIVLRDAPNWNVTIHRSEHVRVDDLRIISGRLNSDGINSVNARDVDIRRCFVRNHDDSIVAKTTAPEPPAEDIRVEDCTVWNDWGYALGATYETRAPIRRVAFRHCDILFARHWCLGVRVCDSATVSDITFTDIRIADMAGYALLQQAHAALTAEPKLLYLSIDGDCWSTDTERGRIRSLLLDDITIDGEWMPASELRGLDPEHDIRDVTFHNVRLQGKPPVQHADELRLEAVVHAEGIRIIGV